MEWGNHFHMVSGSTRRKGLLNLFSKNINPNSVSIILENDRCLISLLSLEDKSIAIANIYGPCTDNEKHTFLNNLNHDISALREKILIDHIILLGDFNIVKNNSLDIISGAPHAIKNVDLFNNTINNLSLLDIWRQSHSNKKDFSWSSTNPFTARRLDYIFINPEILPFCVQCEYINLGLSDHKAMALNVDFSSFKRGHDCYKFNVNLLHNLYFVNEVKNEINRIKQLNMSSHLKWEYIKVQIRSLGKIYGKSLASEKNMKMKEIRSKLDNIEYQLTHYPDNLEMLEQQNVLKRELDIFIMNETEGARIRSRQIWAEKGEKCSKFFLNLEKHRSNLNTIFRVKREQDDRIIIDCEDILSEINTHFKNLYKFHHTKDNDLLFGQSTEQPLNDDDISFLEKPITESDILLALKNSKNGSAPGLDGLPAEVYKFFWNDIKKPLIDCINFSYDSGELCTTQKQGVMCLIFKGKGLNRELISNWRPISLINFDYKLIAKTLSMKLLSCISKCIGPGQFAFIKGRRISDMLREIDDITEFGKFNKTGSIILSLDYAKAFDTLSLDSIIKALDHFGFGEKFIKWINILLLDRKSCIRNGGHLSDFFDMQRGVRQGCPISPLLFILTVEILAKNIRRDERIKGIHIPGSNRSIKILSYADDTTLFLKDLMDFREILSKIKSFSEATGLHLNKSKSNAMYISQTDQKDTFKYGIKFVNRLKILGVLFSNECSTQHIKENYTEKIAKLEHICALWSKRHLTLLGKITVLKSFGLSLFIHIMQSIGINREFLDKINQIFFRFIWKNSFTNTKATEKVKRITICNKKINGGLNTIDITTMQQSFFLEWAERYLSFEDHSWRHWANMYYKKVGGCHAFKSNTLAKSFKGLEFVESVFWKNVLSTWLNKKFDSEETSVNNLSPIFNNQNIKYRGETIFLPQCFQFDICVIGDMLIRDRILTFTEFKNKYKLCADAQLVYNILFNALQKYRNLVTYTENDSINFKNIKVGNIGRKGFYNIIRNTDIPLAAASLSRKFNININGEHWLSAFSCSCETRLQTFQWKILHGIFPTGVLLKKMNIRQSDQCQYCGNTDTVGHFFFECHSVKELWSEAERRIEIITNTHVHLTERIIIIGLDKSSGLSKKIVRKINRIILIAKNTISKVKYRKLKNFLVVFDQEINFYE